MKNLQTLANELATNTVTVLTHNDLQAIKGGCFLFSSYNKKSYSGQSACGSTTPTYSCGSTKSNTGCGSSNNSPGRGNGGGEA